MTSLNDKPTGHARHSIMHIPGLVGEYACIDGEMLTVISYRDVEVYVRDQDSVTHILREHTDFQSLALQTKT